MKSNLKRNIILPKIDFRSIIYNPSQKSWNTFGRPSLPESLQALSTLLGGGGRRAVTKIASYKQSNRLTLTKPTVFEN